MFSVSWFWRITALVIALLLSMSAVLGVSAGLSPDTPWFGQVEEVPLWLRIWLMWVLFPAFIFSLAFVHRSNGARLAAIGFILSHVPMFVPMFEITVGVVGVLHVLCWGPALVVLAKEREAAELKSFYGAWLHLMLLVLAVSLTFDFRDAVLFLITL